MTKAIMRVVDCRRERGAFSNPVVAWSFEIKSGPRCNGLVSTKEYKSRELAYAAGERMLTALSKASDKKMRVIDGRRERGAFCNPVVTWRFEIRTGPRCHGLVSVKDYKSIDLVYAAGERMLSALTKAFSLN